MCSSTMAFVSLRPAKIPEVHLTLEASWLRWLCLPSPFELVGCWLAEGTRPRSKGYAGIMLATLEASLLVEVAGQGVVRCTNRLTASGFSV